MSLYICVQGQSKSSTSYATDPCPIRTAARMLASTVTTTTPKPQACAASTGRQSRGQCKEYLLNIPAEIRNKILEELYPPTSARSFKISCIARDADLDPACIKGQKLAANVKIVTLPFFVNELFVSRQWLAESLDFFMKNTKVSFAICGCTLDTVLRLCRDSCVLIAQLMQAALRQCHSCEVDMEPRTSLSATLNDYRE